MADTDLLQPEASTRTISPSFDDIVAGVEAKFQQGVSAAIDQAHRAGLAVPVLDDNGQAAWLHPDGIIRATRDPGHHEDDR